jgi:6,7-dimethyl-8-ribityllumazine synthase
MLQNSSSQDLPLLNPLPRIAIVRSSYYDELVTSMQDAAEGILLEAHIKDIEMITVPGAFEIPLTCKKLAEGKEVDGIIAIGIIVQGETHHAGEIARACTDGLMQVQVETNVPIAHEVLFVDAIKQAEERCQGESNKGAEAAKTLLNMISILQKEKIV